MDEGTILQELGYLKARVEDQGVQLARIDLNVDLLLIESHQRRGAMRLLALLAGIAGSVITGLMAIFIRWSSR